MNGPKITLAQVLESRDRRALYQRELIQGFGLPLVSLTVNMPGEVKLCDESRAAFTAACAAVREKLAGKIVCAKVYEYLTGSEGYFVVDADARALKEKMCEIECEHPLGRLFDADVIGADMKQISREELRYPPRACIVCGKQGAGCARSRAHSSEELSAAVARIIALREEGK